MNPSDFVGVVENVCQDSLLQILGVGLVAILVGGAWGAALVAVLTDGRRQP